MILRSTKRLNSSSLVDCMVVNPETDQFEHQYRWFEVPEDFEEEE